MGELFALSGQLYSLNLHSGRLSMVQMDGGALHLQEVQSFNADALASPEGGPRMIKNSLMTENGIWLLVESLAGQGYDLLLLNHHSGEVIALRTRGILSIAPYQDGQLLVLLQGADGARAAIAAFDPQTDKASVLIQATEGTGADGLCYDAASHTAYYVAGGSIYAHPGLGKPLALGYLPAAFLHRNPLLLSGHMVALLPEGLVIRSLSAPQGAQAVVRVYGLGNNSFLLNRVRAMLPDIRIQAPEQYLTALELAQAVITNSFPYDVAVLSLNNTQLHKLMAKGYLADLGQHPETARVLRRLYPIFLTPLTQDGVVYGLPSGISMPCYSYQQATLDMIGMRPDELPTDILAYLDFIASWRERPQALEAGVLPTFALDKQELLIEVMGLYITQHQLRGLPLRFDTPLFREMLNKLAQLDDAYLSSLRQWDAQQRRAVIDQSYDLRDLGRKRSSRVWRNADFEPISMALMPDTDRIYPYTGSAALVLRGAADFNAAARVAAALCEADWAQSNAPVLFQDYQPVISDNYLENMATAQQNAQYFAAQMDKATGAEKTRLSEQLADTNRQIELMAEERFVATLPEVAVYQRDVLPYLRAELPSLMYDIHNLEDQSFFRLYRQFIGGAIDSEGFIAEADRILNMMALEDQ